ncbi:MAG: DUF2723 domain-containing protein [candidate division WOR-3 bacterium]
MRGSFWPIVLVPSVVFGVYLLTLYPTVGWVDCGEIAAGCYLLNVLHPTGYPLYTLIGCLFAHLPLGTVVTRVNALSALCSALAALFCCLAVQRLTRSTLAGIVTAGLYAFSYTVWSNSVDADVFGLTALYVALSIYLLVRLETQEPDRQEPDRLNLLFVAYLLGLALTNHLSFASTFLGAVVFLLHRYRSKVLNLRVLPPLVGAFVLGLSPYLYLLVRSQAHPLFNWGDAHSLERLIWHVTGKQFQVWMFSLPVAEVVRNLGKALLELCRELYFGLVLVLVWGAWLVFKTRRAVFWLLSVVLVVNLFYAINYSIPDIQSYYIPFMVAAFIFTGVGLAQLVKRLKTQLRPLFLVIVAVAIAVNYRRGGAQGNYVARDFGLNYLTSAPEQAIVMTTNWDMYSPVFYLRQIEGRRPDLCVIDKELLRRSWYFQSLEQEYPWLVARSRAEIDRYRHFLDQFEHNTLRDVKGIQDAFIAMISSFVTRNPERRVFLTFDERTDSDARQLLPGYLRIPYGLYYELSRTVPWDSFDYNQLLIRRPNLVLDERTRANISTYERFALERAGFLMRSGRREEAIQDVNWVLEHFPDSHRAREMLSRLQIEAGSSE